MPRVTSQKTRTAQLVTDFPYDARNPPDKLALYTDEGETIDITSAHGMPLGGSAGEVLTKVSENSYDADWMEVPPPPDPVDATALHFKGPWVAHDAYLIQDLVIEGGFVWLALDDVPDSALSPSALAAGNFVTTPGSTGVSVTAKRILAGLNSISPPSGDFWSFVDCANGLGNYTFDAVFPGGHQWHQIFNAAGSWATTGLTTIPLTVSLATGRFFIHTVDPDGGVTSGITLTPNGAAQLTPVDNPWMKFLAVL